METWQALLAESVSALLAAEEPAEVLPSIYRRLSELTGLEVFLHLDANEHRSLRMLAAGGFSQKERDRLADLDYSATLCGHVAATGTPVVLDDVETSDDPRTGAVRSLGLRAYICQPLVVHGQLVGTLSFGTRNQKNIPAESRHAIHIIGELVASTVARHRAEQDRRRSEERYRQLFASIDEGVCVLEMIFDEDERPLDYRFLEINPTFERQTGVVQPVGRTARELVPGLDESWFRIYGDVALTGRSIRFENEAPAMNRTFEVYALRVGRPADRQVALVFKDVTERKRREATTAFLADIHTALANASEPEPMMRMVGEKLKAHLGLSRVLLAELDEQGERLTTLGDHTDEHLPSSTFERLVELVPEAHLAEFSRGQPWMVEDVGTDPRLEGIQDGLIAHGIVALVALPLVTGGRLRRVFLAARSAPHTFAEAEIDLLRETSTLLWIRVDRAEAEAEIRESERHFRTMADTAPAMLWIADESNYCTFLSRAWYEFTGQREEDGLGIGWLDVVHPDDRDAAERITLRAIARREAFSIDYRLRRRDGTYRWCIDSAHPRYDANGNFIGHIGSVIDVHDRKVAEEAVREADRRKDHFMAVLSHELRNPLAPIQNGLDVLDIVPPDSPQAVQTREILRRQVEQLRRLVDDLLDVTRISRDKVALQFERLELNDLVRHTAEDHRSLFEERGIHFSMKLAARPVYVRGDRNRLMQAIGNLLQNAAKFTPRGENAVVEVECDAAAHRGRVRVTDTGIGMDPRSVTLVFQPFMQADSSLARPGGGLGLGLALVKGLAELHGGEVEAKSEGVGRGASFSIALPLDAEQHEEHPGEAPPTNSGPQRVLIIEDMPDVAHTLRAVLEGEGHVVKVAQDGREGLELAKAFAPSVVLCDIGLPGMNGYEVARALRADPALRSAYCVALSGYAMPEDVRRSKEAGFEAHHAKPLTRDGMRRLLALASRASRNPS